jgi:hypothetical protein
MSDPKQSRELLQPGETDVAAPALPPSLSPGRLVGRAAAVLTGWVFVLLGGLGIIGGIFQLVARGHGSSILFSIMGIGCAIGGVSTVRWALRLAHGSMDGARRALGGAPSAVPVEQLLLAVASEHDGSVTAAEVAAAMAIEPTLALRMLDEAARTGDARILVSPDGIAVYEFPGLLVNKADAKEPWHL